MKRTLGILMATIATIAAVFALTGCATDTSGIQSDIDRLTGAVTDLTDKVNDLTSENKTLTDKVNDLTSENKTLTDKVNDLTTENGALKDRVDGLNVFTTDKAEYDEHDTMTVFFHSKPILKIRLSFDNYDGTALWGNSFNFAVYITSLCADIYDESIIGTALLAWDQGTCVRKQASNLYIIKQNVEKEAGGYFTNTDEAYKNGTWFDLVICVPGTPFELARFKNVSYTK